MTGSWTRKYDTLTPQAAALLRAMVVVETTDPTELAAALGIDVADVGERLAEVHTEGWTEQTPDGRPVLPDDARVW